MIDTRKLSRYTSKQIQGPAQRGNVFISGSGASALFHNIPEVLSARICALMDTRELVMMERLGVGRRGHTRVVARFDASRARTLQASSIKQGASPRCIHLSICCA
jgi:hypothetical protein